MESSNVSVLWLRVLNNTNIIKHMRIKIATYQFNRKLTHNVCINTGLNITDHVQHTDTHVCMHTHTDTHSLNTHHTECTD